MKKTFLLFILAIGMSYLGWGQTTVFTDDFSTNTSATWTTSGAIGASAWTVTRSGADWGARRNISPLQLEQTNDVGATANASGWVFSSVLLSSFSAPYNTTLNLNAELLTWTFNFRTNRTSALAGFTGSTSYGMAMILVSTSNTPNTSGNGYAVVMGGGGLNTIALISFTGGLQGTKTTIIGYGGAPAALTNYMSVKVTYNPSGDNWALYNRDDGSTGFADPASGILTQIGTTTSNSTYTGTAMSYLGAYWQGSTTATQTSFYDNVTVTSTPSGTPTITVSPALLSNFTYNVGSGPSASQSYNLGGSSLTPAAGNITVTAPAHYEVSSDNAAFYASILIPYTLGTLASTSIYVRLIAGLSANYYNNEDVTNAGGGATIMNVTCSGTVMPGSSTTYSWVGADLGDWTVAANWSPTRTIAFTNDILQFNEGTVKTITNVPTQTIAQMSVTNSTAVTLQAAGTITLTIAGGSGTDLSVGSGSQLNVSGANSITMTLSATATGSVSGSMTFAGGIHKLTATDASGITFANGSAFTAGTSFSGNPFGTGTANSVIFQSGASFIQIAGSNPFALTAPASIVVFQTGSLFKLMSTGTPSVSGRTYANFEMDIPNCKITLTGVSAVSIDNLTVTNGTLNFNMTGTPGHSIKGNIAVVDTLIFNPASTGTVNLNGTSLQTISGTGTISYGPALFSTIAITNTAGVILNATASLYNLTISSGSSLTVNAGKALSTSGAVTTNDVLTLKSPAGTGPTGSFLPTGAVTGNVTVERYIPQYTSNADGWYFLSSPVSGQLINPNFAPGSNDDVYRWNETVTDYPWINYKGLSPFTTFESGEGYLVAYQASATKTFTGSINPSNITLNNQSFTGASSWSGWHLLGNPYSCAVKWNDGNWGTMNNVEAVAQVMNSGGTYTSRVANDPIPAMNGFMVHVTSGTNSLTIPLAARTHSGIDWMKSTANIQDKLMLTAASTENTTYVETIVQFNQEATPAFDMAYDGHFLSGIAVAPQLYSIVGEEHLCVNTLPQTDNTRTVHLGFVKGSSVNYTMNVTGLESFNPGVSVFLEDTKASKTQNLRQSSVYSFSAAEGDNANRFLLHFGGLFGVNELNKDNAIKIYSYDNTIYISNNGGQQVKGNVFVYNLMGQLLMQQELGDNKLTTLNLSGSTGYYLVKVITSENSYSAKIFLR